MEDGLLVHTDGALSGGVHQYEDRARPRVPLETHLRFLHLCAWHDDSTRPNPAVKYVPRAVKIE